MNIPKFWVKSIIISFIFFSFFLVPPTHAQLKQIGEPCTKNSDCATDECEDSTLDQAQDDFCVCDDDTECTTFYDKETEPGETWTCKDGADGTHKLNYCLSSKGKTKPPIPTKDPSFTDHLLDPQLSASELEKLMSKPETKITIPGVSFSDIKVVTEGESTFLYIPFLGEYLASIYRYLVIIGGVVAVVAIIVAGFRYILSRGDTGQVESAVGMIKNAVTGLVLIVGSYTILYTVNPELVHFRSLRVPYIQGKSIYAIDKGGYPQTALTPGKQIHDPIYDPLFQKYGNCIPADWRLLKAMAYIESGYNASASNSLGFKGMFQTQKPNCEDSLRKYPDNLKSHCTDLYNPELSTMVGTSMMRVTISMVKKRCPNIANDPDSFYYFAYLGHHGGHGTLEAVLKKTCSYTDAYTHIHSFWTTHAKGAYADSTGKKRTATHIAQEGDRSGKKMIAYVKSLGVNSANFSENKSLCPLDQTSLRFK